MNWKNLFKPYEETYLDTHAKAKQIDDLLQDHTQWEKGIEHNANKTIMKHKEYDIWFYYLDSFDIYNSSYQKVLFVPSCLINRWKKLFLKIGHYVIAECAEAPLEKRKK